MSKENVKEFFKMVGKKDDLKEAVEGAMKGLLEQKANEQVIGDKLVELGAGAGFSFSIDDLKTTREELVAQINAENGELSDEDLEAVAGGGKVGAVVASIASAGVICAAASVLTLTSSDPRSCKELVGDVVNW